MDRFMGILAILGSYLLTSARVSNAVKYLQYKNTTVINKTVEGCHKKINQYTISDLL